MKRILTIFPFIFLCCRTFGGDTLSLKECCDMALKYNKTIAAAAKGKESAQHTVGSYRANFFPDFSLSASGLYSTADGGYDSGSGLLPAYSLSGEQTGYAFFPGIGLNYEVGTMFMGGVNITQPIYMGGRIRSAYRMAVTGAELASRNEELTRAEVIVSTTEAYALLVKATEMKLVAVAYHALIEELLSNVENAQRNGLKSKNDVLSVKVRQSDSELSVRKAENAIRLASMNLCQLVGLPLTDGIVPSINSIPTEIDAELPRGDISARPEYALLEGQEKLAREQIRLERSAMMPQIGLTGSYNYLHGFELNDETLFDSGNFAVMLNVSIPLYHFGERTHKVKAARLAAEQTRLERENKNEQMMLELVQAANNVDEALLECKLAGRTIEQSEEHLKTCRSEYDAGLSPLSDLLEAQMLWQQARQTLVGAKYDLAVARIKYEKTAGLLQ